MHCRKCRAPVEFTPVRDKELARCREFLVLAAVLALIGLVLYLLDIATWPWWFAGIALFVLWQAAFKWHLSRWVMCDNCGARYTCYGLHKS